MNSYASNKDEWIYFKLYVGQAIDRMDQLIVRIGETVPRLHGLQSWFYIRYFDDMGVHIRLRARPQPGEKEPLEVQLSQLCANSLNTLHELVPSSYYPMVVPPGMEEAMQRVAEGGGHQDVRIVSDRYEPEVDKYGGPLGVAIAEDVFAVSSDIACRVLAAEEAGQHSRKDLIPLFMSESLRLCMPDADPAAFWREYSFYWLGGNTPAAGDWREKFLAKSAELEEQGVAVVPADDTLDEQAAGWVRSWRDALSSAVARYREMAAVVDANPEVLAFNFAHLMNNRLGIASLEEAYMATLLEQRR